MDERLTEGCLDEQTVVDFATGALSGPAAATVEKHVGGCARCAELVGVAVRHDAGAGAASEAVATAAGEITTQEGRAGDPRPPATRGALRPEDLARPLLEAGTPLDETHRIVRFVGRGAMGEVYEVSHARLAGRYAAKILSLDMSSNPQAFSRFRREALIASGLSHPNIVQVIDFRHDPASRPYLVMEFLEGKDLAQVLTGGRLPLGRAMPLVRQMVSALGALHGHQIIHRDLKPQNIFVLPATDGEPERVKLVDFGLAKRSNPSLVVTHDRALLGTPQYMAPEQALGNADTLAAEADQFSLGTIVYEMLSGRPAFAGDSLSVVLYRIVHEAPKPLRDLVPGLPAHVAAAVERALAKKPADRFPSVKAFLQALQAERPAQPGATPPTARAPARGPMALVAGVLVLLATAAGLWALTGGHKPAAAPAQDVAVAAPAALPAAAGVAVAPAAAPEQPAPAVKDPPAAVPAQAPPAPAAQKESAADPGTGTARRPPKHQRGDTTPGGRPAATAERAEKAEKAEKIDSPAPPGALRPEPVSPPAHPAASDPGLLLEKLDP